MCSSCRLLNGAFMVVGSDGLGRSIAFFIDRWCPLFKIVSILFTRIRFQRSTFAFLITFSQRRRRNSTCGGRLLSIMVLQVAIFCWWIIKHRSISCWKHSLLATGIYLSIWKLFIEDSLTFKISRNSSIQLSYYHQPFNPCRQALRRIRLRHFKLFFFSKRSIYDFTVLFDFFIVKCIQELHSQNQNFQKLILSQNNFHHVYLKATVPYLYLEVYLIRSCLQNIALLQICFNKLMQRQFNFKTIVLFIMMPNSMKRLQKQKEFWQKTPPPDIRGRPKNAQLTEWQFVFRGPNGSPYAHLYFIINAEIPQDYPTSPPVMRFATFIFHPNISPHTGNICIDVLKAQWKPEVTMAIVLGTIIHGLLLKPVPDDPLNAQARDLYKANLTAFNQRARQDGIARASFKPPVWAKF